MLLLVDEPNGEGRGHVPPGGLNCIESASLLPHCLDMCSKQHLTKNHLQDRTGVGVAQLGGLAQWVNHMVDWHPSSHNT